MYNGYGHLYSLLIGGFFFPGVNLEADRESLNFWVTANGGNSKL